MINKFIQYEAECDKCGAMYISQSNNKQAFINELCASGWKIRKDGAVYCKQCKE